MWSVIAGLDRRLEDGSEEAGTGNAGKEWEARQRWLGQESHCRLGCDRMVG
jgi:hypothetical protein